MSAPAKKIVIKSSAKTAQVSLPLTQKSPAATPLQQKKVVVKAAAPAAPKKAVVQRQVVSAAKKLVFAAQEEEEEDAPSKTRDELLMEALALLQAALGMSGGKKKGFNKDGTPRAKRVNNSGWNQFVKDFCAENPGVSWKDAMVLCKGPWAELKGESASTQEDGCSEALLEETVTVVAAPAPKKLVISKSGAKTAQVSVTAAAAAMAALEAAKAEAEAAAALFPTLAELAAPSTDVEEFEHEGVSLLKNSEGFCWRLDEDGEQVFVGRWDATEEKMDETASEPVYGESA